MERSSTPTQDEGTVNKGVTSITIVQRKDGMPMASPPVTIYDGTFLINMDEATMLHLVKTGFYEIVKVLPISD